MVAAHVASLHNKYNLFEVIGNYDLDFKICADYDLLIRKRDKLKYLFLENHIARMKVECNGFSTKAIIETYRVRRKIRVGIMCMNVFIYMICSFLNFVFRVFEGTKT